MSKISTKPFGRPSDPREDTIDEKPILEVSQVAGEVISFKSSTLSLIDLPPMDKLSVQEFDHKGRGMSTNDENKAFEVWKNSSEHVIDSAKAAAQIALAEGKSPISLSIVDPIALNSPSVIGQVEHMINALSPVVSYYVGLSSGTDFTQGRTRANVKWIFTNDALCLLIDNEDDLNKLRYYLRLFKVATTTKKYPGLLCTVKSLLGVIRKDESLRELLGDYNKAGRLIVKR